MRTLIVDDEPLACARLTRMCRQRPELQVVAEAGSGAAAIAAIRAHHPDLVLLDVELQDMTGFDVLRALDIDQGPVAIMVTAHPEYALQAFATEAVDFLTKPVDADRFASAIARARRRVSQGERGPAASLPSFASGGGVVPGGPAAPQARLVGERAHRLYFLDLPAVDYIESDGNYVIIHSGEERYISRNTLKHLSAVLAPAGFLRIEKSLLINLRRIAFAERIGQGEFAFTMRGGQRLVSSRSYRRAIIEEIRRDSLT
jgi:two-component system, LytTR family, response regulator